MTKQSSLTRTLYTSTRDMHYTSVLTSIDLRLRIPFTWHRVKQRFMILDVLKQSMETAFFVRSRVYYYILRDLIAI